MEETDLTPAELAIAEYDYQEERLGEYQRRGISREVMAVALWENHGRPAGSGGRLTGDPPAGENENSEKPALIISQRGDLKQAI